MIVLIQLRNAISGRLTSAAACSAGIGTETRIHQNRCLSSLLFASRREITHSQTTACRFLRKLQINMAMNGKSSAENGLHCRNLSVGETNSLGASLLTNNAGKQLYAMGYSVVRVAYGLVLAIYYTLEYLVFLFVPRSAISKDISGQIILVTGGGMGIGRLICQKLAKLGGNVVIWDINKEASEETVKLIKSQGGQAKSFVCDVSSRENVYAAARRVKEEVGKVSILINNAGIVTGKSLLDAPDHMIQKTFDVNSLAPIWITKAFLPDMIVQEKGHIVTIASMAGMVGLNRMTDYCASKFAALGFHESLVNEMEYEGRNYLKFTVVCPDFINTGMFDGTKFSTLLDPEYVADEIVAATLANSEVLILPKRHNLIIPFKYLTPFKAFRAVLTSLGQNDAMMSFKGRQKGD